MKKTQSRKRVPHNRWHPNRTNNQFLSSAGAKSQNTHQPLAALTNVRVNSAFSFLQPPSPLSYFWMKQISFLSSTNLLVLGFCLKLAPAPIITSLTPPNFHTLTSPTGTSQSWTADLIRRRQPVIRVYFKDGFFQALLSSFPPIRNLFGLGPSW